MLESTLKVILYTGKISRDNFRTVVTHRPTLILSLFSYNYNSRVLTGICSEIQIKYECSMGQEL